MGVERGSRCGRGNTERTPASADGDAALLKQKTRTGRDNS